MVIKEPKRELLRSYNKFWKTPFKIYSIDNMKLIVPINPWELLYFVIGIIIMFLVGKLLSFPKSFFVLQYVILPYAFMKFVSRKKLDGKMPLKFFWDLIVFKLFTNKEFERFQPMQKSKLKGFKVKIRYKTGGNQE